MKLPIRLDTHIKESASWKVLQNNVPATWIIREVSERDYGIDCYIELVNRDSEITGDLLSVQLKGTEIIKWEAKDKKENLATFSGIKIETIHYWMSLPVPVFLFVADLSKSNLYFVPIKQQVRTQYSKYLKQVTMSFTLRKDFQLGTDRGLNAFLALYFLEKSHKDFESNLRTLLVHWHRYIEFIQTQQNLDCFMGAEPDEELLFIHIYIVLEDMSHYMGLDWGIESLDEILRKDHETWKDDYCLLHYQTFTNILPALETKFFEIIGIARDIVTNREKEYWESKDLILYRIAERLNHLTPGYN